MLLTYNENAKIPAKLSVFYNQAYEALFQRHDANKGGFERVRKTTLDIQDFSRVFSFFCLQSYEKRLFKMSRIECLDLIEKTKTWLEKDFNVEGYLTDLLSAACLMIEDGLEIAFSHRSFQEYFVAIYISTASPVIQKELISRYWRNLRADNVINLLLEIDPELIERELFIPVLHELFKKLGVNKKVGITHTAKYLKTCFLIFKLKKKTYGLDMQAIKLLIQIS
jgi:predicted NACHT family NTPase